MVGLHFRRERFLHTYSWRDEAAPDASQHFCLANSYRVAQTLAVEPFERVVAIP
jgi:hypothetical protein